MTRKISLAAVPAAALFLLTACGGEQAEAPAEASTAADASPGQASMAEEAPASLPRSESLAGASVYFITPQNGATVTNPVKVEFGIDGMDLVPAGEDQPFSGHHHLLIDTELPPLGQPIPADANHIHFGDGSSSTELNLEPGQHTLLLLLGDHLHIPHDPPVSSPTITITVE